MTIEAPSLPLQMLLLQLVTLLASSAVRSWEVARYDQQQAHVAYQPGSLVCVCVCVCVCD